MLRKTRFLAVASTVLLALSLAGLAAGDLGRLSFPNSGPPEAQDAFVRGTLLLHSFEYEDAREAFQEAREIAPDFALAAWGEAMTHNHPLWRQQDRDAARAALERLAPTLEERLAKAPTERERGFLRAVEVLYGEGDKVDRDRAYSDAMRELSLAHPDDLEAKSFYALSILGTAQGVRDFAVYMRAGAVAEEVFAANPHHPGAAHYLIHSYDDPVHAPLGLRAARVYAEIAPAASHAQHMISHIFVALGRWEDSVDANIQAFEVSRERAKRKELDVDSLNYHALHWLEYSYLQMGQLDAARAKLEMMEGYARESGSVRALGYYASMRAAWAAETGGTDVPPGLSIDAVHAGLAAADLFASGYAALRAGNVEEARKVLERLDARLGSARVGTDAEHCSVYAADSEGTLAVARVMADSLRGLVLLEEGRTEQALAVLDEATALEAAQPLDFGPPAIVKPSHEIYGEVLMRLSRPEQALEQFHAALERAPRRSLSLAGVARAASVLADEDLLADACNELASIYAEADESFRRPKACRAPRSEVASAERM